MDYLLPLVIGFRIVVESQYPLATVHETIEQALEQIGDFLDDLTPETVERTKQAWIASKLETTSRMRDAAALWWKEILDATYNFSRTSEETEEMAKLTVGNSSNSVKEGLFRGKDKMFPASKWSQPKYQK